MRIYLIAILLLMLCIGCNSQNKNNSIDQKKSSMTDSDSKLINGWNQYDYDDLFSEVQPLVEIYDQVGEEFSDIYCRLVMEKYTPLQYMMADTIDINEIYVKAINMTSYGWSDNSSAVLVEECVKMMEDLGYFRNLEAYCYCYCDKYKESYKNPLMADLLPLSDSLIKKIAWDCISEYKQYLNKNEYELSGEGSGNSQELISNTSSSFIDNRDGKRYYITQIGNQVWMTENLSYKPQNEGYWRYNNDESNLRTYGYLYNWNTACNVCPKDWHLPDDSEWMELERYLGIEEGLNTKGFHGEAVNAGGKLKSSKGWDMPNKGASNSTGFSALPAGDFRSYHNEYFDLGSGTLFWTSTPSTEDYSWARSLSSNNSSIFRATWPQSLGFSVRCLKDKTHSISSPIFEVLPPYSKITREVIAEEYEYLISSGLLNEDNTLLIEQLNQIISGEHQKEAYMYKGDIGENIIIEPVKEYINDKYFAILVKNIKEELKQYFKEEFEFQFIESGQNSYSSTHIYNYYIVYNSLLDRYSHQYFFNINRNTYIININTKRRQLIIEDLIRIH